MHLRSAALAATTTNLTQSKHARTTDSLASQQHRPLWELVQMDQRSTNAQRILPSYAIGSASTLQALAGYKTRKNPANTKVFTGFSSIGPAGFEPTTSTTPRYEHVDVGPTKTRAKLGSGESLPHPLPQKPISGQLSEAENRGESKPRLCDDPQMERLFKLFSVADGAQRTAILAVAEAIVPTSPKPV